MPDVAHPLQSPLPQLFPPSARRAHLAGLAGQDAIRLSSEALMRTLNAIAFDPRSGTEDTRVTRDRRLSAALTVAIPLSLAGRPARPERFSEVERRIAGHVREAGVLGPCGRALQAAQLLTRAVAGSPEVAAGLASRAVDCAVEAEVLAAVLHDGSIDEARATAERRFLDIRNARPGPGGEQTRLFRASAPTSRQL